MIIFLNAKCAAIGDEKNAQRDHAEKFVPLVIAYWAPSKAQINVKYIVPEFLEKQMYKRGHCYTELGYCY